MTTKTPRELLRESLEANSREVATWPAWIRRAVSTANIFAPAPPPPKVTPEGMDATNALDPATLIGD